MIGSLLPGAASLGVLAGLFLWTSLAPAGACYSGLVMIPTAETVGDGQYGLEPQVDGPIHPLRAATRLVNVELGVSSRLEVGVDFDVSRDASTRAFMNAKYVLAGCAKTRGAAAIGICNAGRGLRAGPYLAMMRNCRGCRGHAGVIGVEGACRWFVGLDRPVGAKLTLMADYTRGNENFSSVGVSYQFRDNVGLLLGAQFPNTGGQTLFTAHVVINGPYRKHLKED